MFVHHVATRAFEFGAVFCGADCCTAARAVLPPQHAQQLFALPSRLQFQSRLLRLVQGMC